MDKKFTILVALHFSENPEEVLRRSLSVAKKYDAKIYTIHVIEDMPRQTLYYDAYKVWEEFRDRAVKETLEHMNKYLVKLGEDFDDIEAIIEVGNPTDKILQKADELDVNLIIVGHHVRKGVIKQMIHSSISEKVVRFSKRPVLTFYVESEDIIE